MKHIAVLATVMALAGCASVMNDTTQGVRVDTKTAQGAATQGAECTASNDYGTTNFKSGSVQALRRSGKDMEISCTYAGQPAATGRLTSRANGAMAGNIILGGVIGAVVDHNRGTAYTYPTWIEMVFGQSLVFDRSSEKEGTAMKGVPADQVPMQKTASGTLQDRNSHACMQRLPGTNCPE